MATAVQVARYITRKQSITGRVQLLKLVYYVQAWALAWDGRPMFDEPVEAWELGPVVRSVWNVCNQGQLDTDGPTLLSPAEESIVDSVLDFYGHRTGAQLSALTHSEHPWLKARGNLADDAWSDTEITRSDMREYYTLRSLSGNGPTRKSPARESVSSKQLLSEAASQAERWRETLAILAK